MYCTLHQRCLGGEIKKTEKVKACGRYGGEEGCRQGFVGET